MKKIISLLLSFIILLSTVSTVSFTAMAASVNASEVSLYYIKDNYKEKIGDVPKNYNKSFQLRVSGASNVRYTVKSGDSATVSSSGLVEPKATVWYWYGGMGSTFPMPEYGEPTSVETDYEEGDTVVEVRADSITEIADSAFNSCENLESINLPASLETLGNFVFSKCNKLTDIKSSSPNFPAKDGVIYNKDKSAILYAPAVKMLSMIAVN